jgi:osmotically-inducible protein OsmY
VVRNLLYPPIEPVYGEAKGDRVMPQRIKSDAEIQRQVLDELKWDSRINEAEVGVVVDRGTVTLTGTVDCYAKKLVAQEAAHLVRGVLDVANDIQVRTSGSPALADTALAQAVRRAIEWSALVPAEQVETTVSNGWVTLTGEVGSLRERVDAERAIQELSGVKGVTNAITVKTTPVQPRDLKRRIEETLARRADREANGLGVEVRGNGDVTVSGIVTTWSEARAILSAIRFAPGVRYVENRMTVDPSL